MPGCQRRSLPDDWHSNRKESPPRDLFRFAKRAKVAVQSSGGRVFDASLGARAIHAPGEVPYLILHWARKAKKPGTGFHLRTSALIWRERY